MLNHPILQVRNGSGRYEDAGSLPPSHAFWIEPRTTRPVIRVSLFKGFALHLGDRELVISSCKARALLAFLLMTPGMRETRERLVGMFWSATEDCKARASLRQLLHRLRGVFDGEGLDALCVDHAKVGLAGAMFVTDLDLALASIDRGTPCDSLLDEPRIADGFLRGYEDTDASFGEWLAITRESVRQLLIRKLEGQLSAGALRVDAARRVAHALWQVDPTSELACRHLMHACATVGNAGAALAAYKRLWDCLELEFDVEPSRITQELAVAIKSGTYQPSGDLAAASLD